MNVPNELIKKVGELAKLKFEESELESIRNDFEKILNFIEKINEIDTEGVDPLFYVNDNFVELREDVPITTLSKEEALKNAPKTDGDYFRVPKFVGNNQSDG